MSSQLKLLVCECDRLFFGDQDLGQLIEKHIFKYGNFKIAFERFNTYPLIHLLKNN